MVHNLVELWALIIKTEIWKVAILQLKVLNKYSITHIMYTEMEMLSAIKMYCYKKKEKKELM